MPAASGAPPTTSATVQQTTVHYGDSAATVESALGTILGGSGNVDVQKAGNVYRIAFQGSFKGTAIPLLLTDPANLKSGAGELDTLNIDDSGSTAAQDAAVLRRRR